MDGTNLKVVFQIWKDDFNVDNVNSILDISNVVIKKKGDKSTHSNVKIKMTSWSIGTGYKESLDINEQLKEVVKLLDRKKSELKEIKELYEVDYLISIVINVENGQIPAIYLEADVIKFANEIQAEFDFDLYIMS